MYRLQSVWPVLGFFFFYFFVLQLFSDLQYALEFGEAPFQDLRYRLFTTPLNIAYYLLFFFSGPPLLLRKRYLRFGFAVLLFVAGMELYLHFTDWTIWHNPFLKIADRLRAEKNLERLRFPRQSLWLTTTHLFTVTGFAYYLGRRQQERALQALREDHLHLQNQYLKNQLQPHFFFNTLNSIYSLALHRSDQTAAVVHRLAHLMRYVVYRGDAPVVALREETAFLEDYIALEALRQPEACSIAFRKTIDEEERAVPPLLLMPLVENAFKHGFADGQQRGWMHARLQCADGRLLFEVRNALAAPREDRVPPGVGLQNLHNRLQLLYPGRHELKTGVEDKMFVACLTIRLL